MNRLIILNPGSKHGKAGRDFSRMLPDLRIQLPELEVYRTKAPGDCTTKVRHSLKSGNYDQILIAGGDGTINEAVNGYFEDRDFLGKNIPLGIINLGTGGDLKRTLRRKSLLYDVALKENQFRTVDCGRITFSRQPDNIFHFINMTSLGLSGQMLKSLKNSTFQWGAPAYFYHSIKTLFSFDPVMTTVDYADKKGNEQTLQTDFLNFFICNGSYNGGGMNWAPRSEIDDGLFDIVVIGGVSKTRLIMECPKIYSGQISQFPGVKEFRASKVRVTPLRDVHIEMDGEICEWQANPKNQICIELLPARFPLVL